MASRRRSQPEKAYNNTAFLNSTDARLIRIMSEYMEPGQRFRRQNVRDTIVFYGSARACDRETASRRLDAVQRQLALGKTDAGDVRRAETVVTLSEYYEAARTLAQKLTEWSNALTNGRRYLICSGGGPGIMEAANRGAADADGRSVGLNISLPAEQFSNDYITEELSFEFHYFFMRKFWFVYLAKALVIFPGGFGTCDELFELITLMQTRKVTKKLPIVVYGTAYWHEVIDFEAMVRWGTIDPEDLDLIRFVDSTDEAFTYLTETLSDAEKKG